MDDSGHRENGRQKPAQGQWLMQHQPSMKQIMTIMAERDAAIQERNLAISEKKSALAERDMAILQRDSAIAERNNASMERDNAIATLQYNDNNTTSPCPPGCQISRNVKHIHHPQSYAHHHQHPPSSGGTGGGGGDGDSLPISPATQEPAKSRRSKPTKDTKSTKTPTPKKTSRSSKKVKMECDDLNRGSKPEWKDEDVGLNQVPFDDLTMLIPVCSCTGVFRACYKWGNGGWQSSCCTTTMSMHPLPSLPNKRHARVGGRKMSGNVFNKLISRLVAQGHDLSNPVDLKEHWAKHGTNRYITIK